MEAKNSASTASSDSETETFEQSGHGEHSNRGTQRTSPQNSNSDLRMLLTAAEKLCKYN